MSRRWAVGFAVSIADLNRLRELFVTLFIPSFAAALGGEPPQRITLDLDAWDDETHGQQQLSTYRRVVAAVAAAIHRDSRAATRVCLLAIPSRFVVGSALHDREGLVRQRQWIADPPAPAPEVSADSPPQLVPAAEALPTEALPGLRRRRYFNPPSADRREDPLGEGHISTWHTRITKVAAEVVVSTRRIVIRLSSSWPYLKLFLKVAQANATLATT